MAVGRRGVFLSLGAILISALIIYGLQAGTSRGLDISPLSPAQDLLRDYQILTEEITPMLVRDYGILALDEIARSLEGEFLLSETELNQLLSECVTTGTPRLAGCDTMRDELVEQLEILAETYHDELGYDVEITLRKMEVAQSGPYEVRFVGTFDIWMRDREFDTQLHREENVQVRAPITGVLDPYATYYLGVERTFKQHDITGTGGNSLWTVASVAAHANEGTYLFDPEGPSFVQRFLGGGVSKQWGLRSLRPNGANTFLEHSAVDYEHALVLDLDEDCLGQLMPDETSTDILLPDDLISGQAREDKREPYQIGGEVPESITLTAGCQFLPPNE